MAKLMLSHEGSILQQRFLDKERLSVGRDPRNQMVVDDPAVAMEHAVIIPVGNDHILEDLQSETGTFVNGARVSRYILQHGDVVQFGAFYLRYLNPRASAEADLDRTMLISGLRVRGNATPAESPPPEEMRVAVVHPARVRLPKGHVTVLAGGRVGSVIELDRVVATFGCTEADMAVITRRPHGYFITQVHGRRRARVNGRPIGEQAQALAHGDVIEVAEHKLEFHLDG
ncbi:MAG TPA: FHA domain-containing protein [Casimicrobiaceae bacterium]|nr:FHA domain-containing protein [Casimicrobiaceae bacterium]